VYHYGFGGIKVGFGVSLHTLQKPFIKPKLQAGPCLPHLHFTKLQAMI